MKQITTMLVMLHLSVAFVCAQQTPLRMKFWGSNVTSTLTIQPDTNTQEALFTGEGTLGPFTYRELNAHIPIPQTSSTCSGADIRFTKGAGVFSFQDGSLLTVEIREGDVCLDPTTLNGDLTVTYEITGGIGRFNDASGTLTLTSKGHPILSGADPRDVVFFTNTGEFEGNIKSANLTPPSGTPTAVISGAPVIETLYRQLTLDGSASKTDTGSLKYSWTTEGTGVAILDSTAPQTRIQIPSGQGDYPVTLTVTNTAGQSASTKVVIHFVGR